MHAGRTALRLVAICALVLVGACGGDDHADVSAPESTVPPSTSAAGDVCAVLATFRERGLANLDTPFVPQDGADFYKRLRDYLPRSLWPDLDALSTFALRNDLMNPPDEILGHSRRVGLALIERCPQLYRSSTTLSAGP
jgi:hypothetical protein